MSSLPAVKRLLPLLSDKEAAEVLALLKYRVSLTPSKSDNEPDWLLHGIERELKRRALIDGRLYEEMVRRLAPNYEADAAQVRATLTLHYNLTRGQRLILGELAAEALADYLGKYTGIGPKVMLTGVTRTVDAFEAAYPDYRASGILTALLPHRTREKV